MTGEGESSQIPNIPDNTIPETDSSADKDITDTDSKEPDTIYTYYEKVYADPADSIFWYGFGQGIMQFFTGSNTSLAMHMSDEFCHEWDYITGQYELVLHSEALPDDAGKEESEYNSRSRSRKRSIVIPDNAEYTPVTRTEYELTYYVNNVNTNNTQVLMEYDENGTLKNSYTYGNERISIDSEEEKDYYLYDGRGSVSQVVNANEIVEAYTYDPFGNVTGGAPDFESFYGYNAEETNPVTGLQYLRARYYDSTTGRFSTADSYLGDVTNPLTLNRYIYTLNNPVMYNDPSGHIPKWLKKVVNSVKETAEEITEWAEETADKVYNWGKKTSEKIYNTATKTASSAKKWANSNIIKPAKIQ